MSLVARILPAVPDAAVPTPKEFTWALEFVVNPPAAPCGPVGPWFPCGPWRPCGPVGPHSP